VSKVHYFILTNFSKIAKRRDLRPKLPLTFSIGDLKFWSAVIWPNCVFSSWLWRN